MLIKVLLLGGFAGLADAQSRSLPELGASDKPAPSLDPLDVDPDYSFLYDTRTIGLDKDGKRYLFEGDVVLIGGGNVITADKIQVDYSTTTLVAEGHVILLHQNEVFTGTRIQMQWKTGDFTITDAVLTANDTIKVEDVSRRILGLSPREIAYDAAREERLREIQKNKDSLKSDFSKSTATEPSTDLLTAYTRLLERERFTRESSPPMLADRDPERRRRLERRRTYWKKSRAETNNAPLPKSFYFRLEGDKLQRRDGNLYQVERGTFTPCRCADDETPAWAFQADEIDAQQEGYVDLHHPVLTIKGVPVLYLPYLKLPLKAKRQSGFLMPSLQSGEAKNGTVYTQPVFLDLGPDADMTVTTDIFQKRGTRLGVETRYEARKYSGFTFQTEMIRDTSWLQLASDREGLLRYHLLEQPFCTDPDPVAKATCEQQITDILTPPGNTWRGKEEWSGRYFLAPRLSIVSAGKVTSDHRYVEDLYLPEDIVTAFANQANANAFSTAKARADFDGKDFYVGIGGSYGDSVWSTERYSGQQMPSYFTLQTRLFRLLPSQWMKIPIYADIQAKTITIDQFNSRNRNSILTTPTVLPNEQTLGSGNWQRFAISTTTPLTTDSVVRVDQFTDAELRVIGHRGLQEKSSTIRSWRTGFALNLPVDGIGPLPSWLRKPEGGEGTSFVKHIMNWGLSLSMRPSVVRDGPYGEFVDENKAPLVYFPSDRKVFYTEDRDVRDEDMMIPHQRVTLSTSHRWQIFDRVLETVPARAPEEEQAEEIQGNLRDMQKEALRELMSVKDQPAEGAASMFLDRPDGGVDWLINRYRVTDLNATEPVGFSVSMSYDNQQEKLRQEQIKRNKELESDALNNPDPAASQVLRGQKVDYYFLPESWLGPYTTLQLNWKGASLATTSSYNIYRNANNSLSFALGMPTFWSSSLAMSFILEKSAELDLEVNKVFFKKIKTTNVGFSSTLLPYVSVGANLIRRQVEEDKYQYGTSYQVAYDSLSGCWGLRFVREKDLNQNEENANYIVQLAVIFLGNRRNSDISPGIKRELGIQQNNTLN